MNPVGRSDVVWINWEAQKLGSLLLLECFHLILEEFALEGTLAFVLHAF